MNEVREGAAHKLKPIVSGITLSPSTSEIRSRTHYTEIIFYIGLRKIGNWVTGSNRRIHSSSRPDLFFIENRVGGIMRIFGQKYSQWIYSTYPFALRCSYTLC